MQTTILIVEDDADLREALQDTLDLAGMESIAVPDAESAVLQLKEQSVAMVVSDINMPGMDGHGLLEHIRKHYPAVPVLLMTAFGQVEKAVDAMRQGAVDYLMKPFEPQVLLDAINQYAGAASVVENEPVAQDVTSQQLFQLARRVADTDSTVLITGESGTGKEVLARYIHQHSPRKEQPFVAINCAAIPENMLEAILFGHEKGAFTGAVASQAGKFEQANHGTLLLDEITEMDLGLQAKLLRVLQEQEVERIGGRNLIALDVRVIATSNRELVSFVQEGRFREDLYYRLNVFPLQWLPLRDRCGDILPLASVLLEKHCRKMQRPVAAFSDAAAGVLQSHPWPGNVRELDNVVQRALILQPGQVIGIDDLHLNTGAIVPSRQSSVQAESPVSVSDSGKLGSDLRQHEHQLILDALKATGGNRKEAAERLSVSPRTLRYKLARMREQGMDIDNLLKND